MRRAVEYAIVWGSVAAGCAVRVVLWWQDRAFWRDELALIQSLDHYSLGKLLGGPLADAQSAPPGWLLLERLTTIVLDTGERAYRLLPLLFGCATLALTALLALRFVQRAWTAAIPVLALATVSQLVFYTAQAKQYTLDCLLVVGLLLVAVHLLSRESPRWLEILWYAGIAVAPWFSHGFMLSAPFVVGWVALVQWRRGTPIGKLAIRLALPAVSVLLAALWGRHLTSQVSDFQSYWAQFFQPWKPFVLRDFVLRDLGFPMLWAVVFVVFGLVAVTMRRWSRSTAVLLVLPALAAYLAALAGFYPFGRRLVLFVVPGLLVLLGVLVDAVIGRVSVWTGRRVIGLVAGLALTAGLGVVAWTTPAKLQYDLTYQYGVDDYRVALRFVRSKWKPGDVVIVGNGDRAALRIYGERLRIPTEHSYRAMPTVDQGHHLRCPIPAPIRNARRVWLVSGDLVPLYPGQMSRYALAAPMLDDYRSVYFVDKGLISVQTLLPGTGRPRREPVRCLSYAPIGPVGAPKFPVTLR